MGRRRKKERDITYISNDSGGTVYWVCLGGERRGERVSEKCVCVKEKAGGEKEKVVVVLVFVGVIKSFIITSI